MLNSIATALSPSVTSMIRLDHAHVTATFHQIHAGTSPGTRQALVATACVALEIHAQLEEEVFYPALRAQGAFDATVLEKNEPEHAEMRRLIGALHGLAPTETLYETTLAELMRTVLHHIADEEATLLPAAERLMPGRLAELGAEMTRRRLALLAPRAGEVAWNVLRSLPQSALVLAAGAVAAPAYLWGRSGRGPGP